MKVLMGDTFTKLDGKNCFGKYEVNIGQVLNAEACQQKCQNDPLCEYAVLNQGKYCYLKGLNEQCIEANDQDSYQKTKLEWEFRAYNSDLQPAQKNEMKGQMSISDCVLNCGADPLCRIAVVRARDDTEKPSERPGIRTCYHRSMATPNDQTTVANVQWVEISPEWHSFAKKGLTNW